MDNTRNVQYLNFRIHQAYWLTVMRNYLDITEPSEECSVLQGYNNDNDEKLDELCSQMLPFFRCQRISNPQSYPIEIEFTEVMRDVAGILRCKTDLHVHLHDFNRLTRRFKLMIYPAKRDPLDEEVSSTQ